MVRNIRVKFDGRVLIPQEPVDLPRDRVLTVEVSDRDAADSGLAPLRAAIDAIDALPAPEDGPQDGAAQHDHYLYGWPKKPQS